MDSASNAVKKSFRKLCARLAKRLKSWLLKLMRNAIWRADEWLHAQEEAIRQEARKPEYAAEVDPVASAARERTHRSRLTVNKRAARLKLPRLKYERGSWLVN